MAGNRQEKINKELRKHFAEFIERESNKTSLVTVTRCVISSDLERVTVYVSVLPTDQENSVINFLKRRQWDARDYIKKKVVLKNIPFVEFQIDLGEKNRQEIDALLKADILESNKD